MFDTRLQRHKSCMASCRSFYYLTGPFATVNHFDMSILANMPLRIDAIHRSQHITYHTSDGLAKQANIKNSTPMPYSPSGHTVPYDQFLGE